MVECKICNREFKNYTSLGLHLSYSHKDISVKEYYDKYLLINKEDKLCPICGKEKKFKTLGQGYPRISCGNKICLKKSKFEIIRKKYGSVYNFYKDISKKSEITLFNNYGDKRAFKFGSKQFEDIINKKYNVKNYWQSKEFLDKRKKDKIKFYKNKEKKIINKFNLCNYDNNFLLVDINYSNQILYYNHDICKTSNKVKIHILLSKKYIKLKCNNKECINNKIKQTKFEKYGNENYINFKKAHQTKLNTIDENGLNSYQKQRVKISKKMKNLSKSEKDNIDNRKKLTFLKNYGVDNISKTKEWKEKIKSNKEIIYKKIYKTKKKNNSFNSSKPEQELLEELKKFYPNIKYQYRDERYPFSCDFYIPEKDLFIELNLYPSHGKEPYDKDNQNHRLIFEEWKERDLKHRKNKNQYKIYIKVWTMSDPKKRKVAKENGLNYIEVFDGYNWRCDLVRFIVDNYVGGYICLK